MSESNLSYEKLQIKKNDFFEKSDKEKLNLLKETNTAATISYMKVGSYNRDNVYRYALNWYNGINRAQYGDFTDLGGDCTNFVSQCIHAGGIPMDTVGPYYWKYYGMTPNETSNTIGRSASWTGAQQFKSYAQNNSGYGLNATLQGSIYGMDTGDVVLLNNSSGTAYHTLIVVNQVIAGGLLEIFV